MFNFEEGKVHFDSVEEVKEFLLSTDDINVLGAICFTGPDGNVEDEIPISVLIEEIGIDKVAEMIFKTIENAKVVSIDQEEILELMKRYVNDEELTEEEKRKLDIFAKSMDYKRSSIEQRRETLFSGITMTLAQSKEHSLFSSVGGLLALMSTYLECALITSDEKLKRAFSNNTTANDISKLACSKIHIDEDASIEMIILGLLHKLGEYSTNSKELSTKSLDFEAIVEVLNLDYDWIFESEEKIKEKYLDDIVEQLKGLKNGSNTDASYNSKQNQDGSNTDDIRNRLKRK